MNYISIIPATDWFYRLNGIHPVAAFALTEKGNIVGLAPSNSSFLKEVSGFARYLHREQLNEEQLKDLRK